MTLTSTIKSVISYHVFVSCQRQRSQDS